MTATVASPEACACLRLHLTPEIGPRRFAQLLEHCGTLDDALTISANALTKLDRIGKKTAETIVRGRDEVDVDAELACAEQLGVRVLCRFDDEYPDLLAQIADPPVCLYVKGSLRPEDAASIAIVGSRRCSHYGKEQSRRFGAVLAGAGFTIVSGLASGIDTFAHYGALDATGRTITVLGCGLAHLYPPENAALAERIVQAGAVISELPLDVAPSSGNFPGRNRIIAGMTRGTIVVEGGKSSGALITAYHALDYDREVFAVPGRVDSPYSAAPHALIARQHAKLITCLEDVLEELGEASRRAAAAAPDRQDLFSPPPAVLPALDDNESAIADVLEADAVHLDEIVTRTGLSPARVAATLITLQLKGVAKQLPGGYYAKPTPKT